MRVMRFWYYSREVHEDMTIFLEVPGQCPVKMLPTSIEQLKYWRMTS